MDIAVRRAIAPIRALPDLRGEPSPCFLFDTGELKRCLSEFSTALPGVGVFYALKANSDPLVLSALAKLDCGFEAASWPEIELLLGLGISPDRIIYGTAVKSRFYVERAVAADVGRFAVDSPEEILMLSAIAPGSRVFVRTKADDSHSVFQMNGKFGAHIGDAADLLRLALRHGLVPWGLSFNVGSQASRPTAWSEAVVTLAPVLQQLLADGITLEILNLGGGFPAPYANHPETRLDRIATPVRDALSKLPYVPRLIVEPGRRLVATSMSLLATVESRIERSDGTWLFLDCGVYNALFEALPYQGSIQYVVERLDVRPSDCSPHKPFTLAGPTGDGLDVISRDTSLPSDTAVGGRLLFKNVGAYTLALASSFNGFPVPPVRVWR